MNLNINKYCCYECDKDFYIPAHELKANYCPYCNSDEIELIEEIILI
jgi:Zn finger protein HypA/HybF involved in hydrogenase expression